MNVGKSEVLSCSTSYGHEGFVVRLNLEELEDVKELGHVGSTVLVGGKMEVKVSWGVVVMECSGCQWRSGICS